MRDNVNKGINLGIKVVNGGFNSKVNSMKWYQKLIQPQEEMPNDGEGILILFGSVFFIGMLIIAFILLSKVVAFFLS